MFNRAEVKQTFPAAAFILALLVSAVAGTPFVNLATANFMRAPESPPYVPPPDPPTISILSPENKTYNMKDFIINFTVTVQYPSNTEIASVYYYLDVHKYSGFGNLSNPFNWSTTHFRLSDGTHTLQVSASSRNYTKYVSVWDVSPYGAPIPIEEGTAYSELAWSHSEITFTIDTISPRISVLSVENKTYNTSDIPLNFAINEPVSQITYSLDEQGNVTIAGNTTITGLSNRVHNVTVYAQDIAGNTGASETLYFSVSQPPPESFPTTLVAASTASAAVVGIGILVYFKKHNH